MNLEKAICQGSHILKANKIKTSRLDSEILMSEVLGKDRKYIFLNQKKKIENHCFEHFKNLIKERSYGKPIAYLVGKKSFWNFEFKVDKNVLIPRPDTELIIEEVLKISRNKKKLQILDIGTGSGCIILSVLFEKKDFKGIGIDISKKCIILSKKNANSIGVQNRIKFLKSDVDNFNYGKYDLIISNPPYIKRSDLNDLERDVVDFEPKLALDGGVDGLSTIKKVIKKSSELVKINGKLIIEIGFGQKEKIKTILKNEGFYINKVLKDYAGKYRCIVSTKI